MSIINPDSALYLNSEQCVYTFMFFNGTCDTKSSQHSNRCSRFPQNLFKMSSCSFESTWSSLSNTLCISQRAFWGFMLENESIQHLKGLGVTDSLSVAENLLILYRYSFQKNAKAFLQQFKMNPKKSHKKVNQFSPLWNFVAVNHSAFRQDKAVSTKAKKPVYWIYSLYRIYSI